MRMNILAILMTIKVGFIPHNFDGEGVYLCIKIK